MGSAQQKQTSKYLGSGFGISLTLNWEIQKEFATEKIAEAADPLKGTICKCRQVETTVRRCVLLLFRSSAAFVPWLEAPWLEAHMSPLTKQLGQAIKE